MSVSFPAVTTVCNAWSGEWESMHRHRTSKSPVAANTGAAADRAKGARAYVRTSEARPNGYTHRPYHSTGHGCAGTHTTIWRIAAHKYAPATENGDCPLVEPGAGASAGMGADAWN